MLPTLSAGWRASACCGMEGAAGNKPINLYDNVCMFMTLSIPFCLSFCPSISTITQV